ncbi:hypothetical protein O7632_13455 [Solwaraspora sp. WMMD406]|uniref:hypothetical protein n=1 Tax=Solwaraspora sp. WMMD406 TaxID=3016095 RepID=UPI0024176B4B|nr:hypothetical protein [Solwaraspora sp. WMMD406]MDG4765094.1 hypothetical protein [Solwaraspora sp. WMMD406]
MTRYAVSRSALGGGLAAGLMVGTVIGVPTDGQVDPVAVTGAGRITASESITGRPESTTGRPESVTGQPDLGDVLLGPADLPAGYHLAGRYLGLDRPAPGEATIPHRCRWLFERPWQIATADAPTDTRDQVVAHHVAADTGAVLRQSLTVLDPAEAAVAVEEIRTAADSCTGFPATLDDGSPVSVRAHRLDRVPDGTATSWSLLLSVTTPGAAAGGPPPQAGYLAVIGIGGVLATVRHLGPIGTVTPRDAAQVLTRAAAKVDPAAPLLRPATATGDRPDTTGP